MSVKTLVLNGWAAGPETWELCSFEHDWVFSYLEELEGLPARVIDESECVLLVGFSMGGTMALKELLRRPDKVAGLVLVSATPCMKEKPGWRGMSDRRMAALRLGTQIAFRGDPSPVYDHDNLERGLRFLDETDLRDDLRARDWHDLPVEILQSERDGIVRPQNAAWLAETFPRARVTMVHGAEHVLPVTATNLVDDAIHRLLSLL